MQLVRDHLVVLDRGWLRSLKPEGGSFSVQSQLQVFQAADTDRLAQLLAFDDTLVALGLDASASAMALARVSIDRAGRLERHNTRYLRFGAGLTSAYASRLKGSVLSLYWEAAPDFPWQDRSVAFDLPTTALASAPGPLPERAWHALLQAPEVLGPIYAQAGVLHQAVACDLGRGDLPCHANGLFADVGVAFQLEADAVLFWTCGSFSEERPTLYRLPWATHDATAVRVTGRAVGSAPIAVDRSWVSVLTIPTCDDSPLGDPGHAAWNEPRLLRLPLADLAADAPVALGAAYRALPAARGTGRLEGSFVGDYLLYGRRLGPLAEPTAPLSLVALAYQSSVPPTELPLPLPLDGIVPMGRNAAVISSANREIAVSTIALHPEPRLVGTDVVATDESGGLTALGAGPLQYEPLYADQALLLGPATVELGTDGIIIAAVRSLRSTLAGKLTTRPVDLPASDSAGAPAREPCPDPHRASRPLVHDRRVFALLGCDVVEASVVDGVLREQRRLTLP